MVQKIDAQNGVLDIGYDQDPSKCASQTQVQGERVGSISRDGRLVRSLKRISSRAKCVTTTRGRDDTYFCSCVYKEAQIGVSIS